MTAEDRPLSPEAFADSADVGPAILDRFRIYADLLVKWQRAINLVGPSTLADPWRRHFLDSAQLMPLIPPGSRTLVDCGSGAGFPGMVLALLGIPEVHLIESDHRKAAFLANVSRETGTPVTVHATRVEKVDPFIADVVTARALAPLDRLLGMVRPFVGSRTISLFPKGQDVVSELTAATKDRKIAVDRYPSRTDPSATILRLSGEW